MILTDPHDDGVSRVERRGVVGTLRQTLGWSLGAPALVALFALPEAVDLLARVTVTGTAATLASLVSLVVSVFAAAVAYVQAAGRLSNRPVAFGDALGPAAGRLPAALGLLIVPLVVVVLVVLALALGGVLGLVVAVPAVYPLARVFLGFPAVVLDGKGPVAGLRTGWRVSSGHAPKLVGLFVVVTLGQSLSTAAPTVLAPVGLGGAVPEDALELLARLVFVVAAAVAAAAGHMALARVYLENRSTGRRSDHPAPAGR